MINTKPSRYLRKADCAGGTSDPRNFTIAVTATKLRPDTTIQNTPIMVPDLLMEDNFNINHYLPKTGLSKQYKGNYGRIFWEEFML